ncbi:MAG: GNAT family N-acetyltransferase [Oscillospiraceae bacterium]|jgi:hypothetical protein|nr:GNAT family N-acetyltransferase [Oscillospiraceae bacterium]
MIIKRATSTDTPRIIELIQFENGGDYPQKEFYEPEYVQNGIISGSLVFFAAFDDTNVLGQSKGLLVGIACAKYETPDIVYTCHLIVLPDCRGHHLGWQLCTTLYDYISEQNIPLVYSLPIAKHIIGQKYILSATSAKPVGALLNRFNGRNNIVLSNHSAPVTQLTDTTPKYTVYPEYDYAEFFGDYSSFQKISETTALPKSVNLFLDNKTNVGNGFFYTGNYPRNNGYYSIYHRSDIPREFIASLKVAPECEPILNQVLLNYADHN